MKFTLNEEGKLVDSDGKVFKIDGEPIELEGVSRQDDVNKAFAREKETHKK